MARPNPGMMLPVEILRGAVPPRSPEEAVLVQMYRNLPDQLQTDLAQKAHNNQVMARDIYERGDRSGTPEHIKQTEKESRGKMAGKSQGFLK